MTEPTIVAIGGGALDEDPGKQQIERYILSLSGKQDPRVCYIPTAGGDSPVGIVRFYSVFNAEVCRPSHLALINRSVRDIRSFLMKQDVIWVGGGNTAAMLAIWRQHGVDSVLREAWQQGTVMCGSSAGAICWHESGVTDSFGLPLMPLDDGLGWIEGSFCPHYDVEVMRRPVYREIIRTGQLGNGLAADNCAAVVYRSTEAAEYIASTPRARIWRLERTADEAGFREIEIAPRLLGD